MIVLVEEIRDEGLELHRELTKELLAEILGGSNGGTGFSPVGPGRLEARFDRVGDKLLLKGEASVKVEGRCRRCLAAVQLDVPIQFMLNLVARPPEPQSNEGEALTEKHDLKGRGASFDLASVDDEVFDGREIDLGAIVREQLLLGLPMDGLCKDDCKGLCALCGEDLNVRECGCERKVTDPRWAALKDIKLNGKRGGS